MQRATGRTLPDAALGIRALRLTVYDIADRLRSLGTTRCYARQGYRGKLTRPLGQSAETTPITRCLLPGRARSTGLVPLLGPCLRPGRGKNRSPPAASPADSSTAVRLGSDSGTKSRSSDRSVVPDAAGHPVRPAELFRQAPQTTVRARPLAEVLGVPGARNTPPR